MKAEIKALFPTPLYKSSIEKSLDKKQLKYLNSLKLKRNNFNSTSEETYLLEKPLFKNLKKEILLKVNDYFKKIIQPADPIVPYITESWFNVTLPGERHHQHKHPNSLVSGVYYLNPSTIFFYKQYDSTIDIDKAVFNPFNGYNYYENLNTNDLILFPSQVEHSVQTYKGDAPRQSIAFNIFIKGKLGTKSRLTKLEI